jgi:23S rRNA (uracil1939-C5)-methyltransferase
LRRNGASKVREGCPMTLRRGNSIELSIDRAAYGGQGLARHEGLIVFVKGGIPGDRVMARITRKKKNYAEAKVTEVLDPSVDRVEAPCPYSGYCGGCQWQHMRYEAQLTQKKGLVEEAISRIGSLGGIPVHPVIPSEKIFAYRNKMEFSFSDRPWLVSYPPPLTPPTRGGETKREGLSPPPPSAVAQLRRTGDRGGEGETGAPIDRTGAEGETVEGMALGLHVPGTYHKVLDIEACLLQQERGNQILREVKRYARGSGLPAYGLKSHQGFWRFLSLRHAIHSDAWMVNVVTSEMRQDALAPLAEILTHRFDNVRTVVNNITARKAAVAIGERERVLSGGGTIEDRIGGFTFQISANSFFQTNTLGAEKLYTEVAARAELTGKEQVLDLYSGTGTIPIFLAGRAAEIVGMEIMESAIQDAERNCRVNGIQNCRFILGDIRENLKTLKKKPDVLIMDPPRAGMHKEVLAGVIELAAERVVYVSCNPATLARDLGEMSREYEVIEVQPVDMFPHTYHVEAVVKLVRRG